MQVRPVRLSGGDILIDGVQTLSILYNPLRAAVSLWTAWS